MKRIILSTLFSACILLTGALSLNSCEQRREKPKVYKTTEHDGYCYNDGLLWYIFFYDSLTGQYTFQGTQSDFSSYDSSSTVNWTPTSENVSNFAENEAVISESVGEDAGGTESASESVGESANDSGISESSGESSGGSDSSSDSGGGDSGGGDGGGGE